MQSVGVIVRCVPNSPLRERNVWGFCARMGASQKALTPNGITTLRKGETVVWLSNVSERPVRVNKGEPVVGFVEANRKDYDVYAFDL